MDVAITLDALVPSPKFGGSLTANTREAYERIRWEDARPKPAWAEIVAKWPEVQAKIARDDTAAKFNPALVVERIFEKLLAGGALTKGDLPAEQMDAINARREQRGEGIL